jgi:hypothetical protein
MRGEHVGKTPRPCRDAFRDRGCGSGERKIAHEPPRTAVHRGMVLPGVVSSDSRSQIVRETRIVSTAVARAFQKVHVVHK